jgi:hypothetical protein
MKRITFPILFSLFFFFAWVNLLEAQTDSTLVSKWGITPTRHGSGWHLTVSAKGDTANHHGAGLKSGWEGIRGAFSKPIVGNTGANGAIVVTGKITFVGQGPDQWSGIRYGVYNSLAPGTLNFAGTDSAAWGTMSGGAFTGMPETSYGYTFMPQSGSTYAGNIPNGFSGSQGIALNGSWISSYAGPGFGGLIQQAPARATLSAGTYNFAFSFHPITDSTKRVNFYLIKEGTPTPYWYGGSYVVMDTADMKRTDTLNAVCFGVESSTAMTNMILSNVHVSLGADITIPAAPFQAFYLDQWGMFGRTGGWKFKVDPDTLIGNAGIGGSKVPSGSWATIRGGFTMPVTATQAKAIIVKGDIEFIGSGPVTWSGLRYGLFNIDSASTVQYAVTDSANWGSIQNKGTDSAKFVAGKENAHGYMFTPQSGTNYVGNIPSGFNASQGAITGGGWISTFSGPGLGGLIQQAPARANFTAGSYKFAISVQPLSDGTNEVRFYMYKDASPVSYFYGGTVIDTTKMTPTFNSICFGLNPNYDQTTSPISAVNLKNVQVDLGSPITIPAPPFQAFYLDQWGLFGRTGGWKFKVDPDSIIGNAGIGGSKVPSGNWATIRGGFTVPVTATQSKAIIVKGDVKFEGSGPVTWSGLRYGLFNIDSASTVQYARTDSANWGNIPNSGADSAKFVAGKENAHGYMFTPQSGTNYAGNIPNGFSASQGVINGGSWISTYSGPGFGGVIQQAPARANFSAGSYKFAISVQPQVDGTNEIRFYMIKDSSVITYWYGGVVKDTNKITTFNSICFGLNTNYDQSTSPISGMVLNNVQVDLGNPINVPSAPWQNYYVSDWGFYQDKMGGWTFNSDIIGNAGISGAKPLKGLAEIRGGFSGAVSPRNGKDSCLVIKGDLTLTDGGFQKAGSFRFGLFNNPTPGSVKVKIDTVAGVVIDSTRWTGSGVNESGYLIIPTSGTNAPEKWGATTGTFGGITNGEWNNTGFGYMLSNAVQTPANAVGSAGTYNFTISVAPSGTGTQTISYKFAKTDKSYTIQGTATDNHNPLPATGFNGIVFALDTGNTTTALKLENVQVTMGKPLVIDGVNSDGSLLPIVYSLSQNYPNPFNPTTTINFSLPKGSKVTLNVYDILGRVVRTLINGEYPAGYHKVEFNGGSMASGVYFYRIEAGGYVNVKKLMLLK